MLNKIFVIAVAGLLLTAGQTAYIIINGDAACLNDGCAVVEDLIAVSPLPFNAIGICYFLVTALSVIFERKHFVFKQVTDTLLLAGIAVEGLLLGFQAFVAGSFCSYCCMVAFTILLMNAMRGAGHLMKGVSIALVQAIFLMILQPPQQAAISDMGLTSGTYAVKTCSHTSKRVFLIFSEKCPHCQNVLAALQGCSMCEVHFNPVAKVKKTILPGLEIISDFNPIANINALKVLGIQEIPVLVAQQDDGYRFIKGESGIIRFIREECTERENPFAPSVMSDFLLTFPEDTSQGCRLDEECNEENQ